MTLPEKLVGRAHINKMGLLPRENLEDVVASSAQAHVRHPGVVLHRLNRSHLSS